MCRSSGVHFITVAKLGRRCRSQFSEEALDQRFGGFIGSVKNQSHRLDAL